MLVREARYQEIKDQVGELKESVPRPAGYKEADEEKWADRG